MRLLLRKPGAGSAARPCGRRERHDPPIVLAFLNLVSRLFSDQRQRQARADTEDVTVGEELLFVTIVDQLDMGVVSHNAHAGMEPGRGLDHDRLFIARIGEQFEPQAVSSCVVECNDLSHGSSTMDSSAGSCAQNDKRVIDGTGVALSAFRCEGGKAFSIGQMRETPMFKSEFKFPMLIGVIYAIFVVSALSLVHWKDVTPGAFY